MDLDEVEALMLKGVKKGSARRRIVPGDGDRRHGTANGYGNLKCRCPECTEAWRVVHGQWEHDAMRMGWRRLRPDGTRGMSAAEWELVRPKAQHGTEAMYNRCTAGSNGGPCNRCRFAASAARASRGRS